MWLKIILLGPQWPKDFKYVLRFDIGCREVGEKIERTDRQTYPQRDFNIDFTLVLGQLPSISPPDEFTKESIGFGCNVEKNFCCHIRQDFPRKQSHLAEIGRSQRILI